MALEDFFTWGSGGRKMTPEQLAAERQALAVMQAREGDTSPVAHWSQGLGRVVNALAGNYRESKADKAEAAGIAQGQAAMAPVLAALMGGGSGGGYTAGGGASGGTWTPAPPPPSATATPGMDGGLGFGASVPAMPAPSAGGLSFGAQPMTPQQMIIAGAEARGLDPIDVATAISYETGGKFDPLISGPTTQWGTHRGLIQFGEPQAKQYGADFSSPEAAMASQLDPETGAVWNYLDSTGVVPGMGLDNIYSAINAGAPGRFNASDANNGGAPGTVADKVAGMGGHRQKAAEFLGGTWTPNPDAGGGNPVTMSTSGQPAAPQGDILGLLMAAQADPWARKQYGPVIDALMGSELSTRSQAQDPMYQLGLQKAQMEVDAMRNPAAPKPIEVGGVLLDPNTFQPIFDSRAADVPEPYTLRTGETRYGADNQPLASGPAAVAPRPLTNAQEREAWGIPATDTRPYAIEEGKPPQLIGGSGVTVNNDLSGGGKFDEAFAKGDAATVETVYNAGLAAQRNLGRIDQLEGLLAASPTGFEGASKQALGEWGINTEGLDAIQSAEAIINSLVPEQRQPGSGPMSDADLALFKKSLPRIVNQPGGNKTIVDTMRAIARYDAEGAQIVQRLRSGELSRAEAFDALQNRVNPLEGFKGGSKVEGPPAGVDQATWDHMTPEEKALFQ